MPSGICERQPDMRQGVRAFILTGSKRSSSCMSLAELQYPHWLILAGSLLVLLGVAGMLAQFR